jgi:two-component system, cell cycle response regulator CpdR
LEEKAMGQEQRATALVVEDDQIQRSMIAMLLEETDIQVIQCESAEAAELVLERVGGCLCMMFTDVNLAGTMTGAELARKARQRFPDLKVIVTSGRNPPDLPEGTMFMPKPWRALDVVREAELSRH